MRSLLRTMVLAGLIAGWVTPALGEYYQYRDQNGVLRFTDDIASIPPDQRPDVTTHQSVENPPAQPAMDAQPAGSPPPSDGQSQPAGASGPDTWQERRAQEAQALDRMQAELKTTFDALQAEREALRANVPPESAPFKERAAYNVEVEALNAKIADYEAQLEAFNQKVEAYNAQIAK